MDVIELDGSYGEGGGQILRSSLALSIITGKSVRINNIRARRKRPGLRPQHLTAVQSAATISDAVVKGAEVNSRALQFTPHQVRNGSFDFDIGTAGAVTLVLQTLLPPLCFAPAASHLWFRGGTHVPWSPSFHYLAQVFLPMASRMGVRANVALGRGGWHPKGAGEVTGDINPLGSSGLRPLVLPDRGALHQITIYAIISNLPEHIAQRECRQADQLLRDLNQVQLRQKILHLPAIGQGTMVLLVAEFEHTVVGFSAMGQIGKRAEQVAEEAVKAFLQFYVSDATVDPYLVDQLLLYMAIASGQSCLVTNHLTEHVRTNIWLIEQFLPVQFQVEGELEQRAMIVVNGCGSS